jgi:hypothetical protein
VTSHGGRGERATAGSSTARHVGSAVRVSTPTHRIDCGVVQVVRHAGRVRLAHTACTCTSQHPCTPSCMIKQKRTKHALPYSSETSASSLSGCPSSPFEGSRDSHAEIPSGSESRHCAHDTTNKTRYRLTESECGVQRVSTGRSTIGVWGRGRDPSSTPRSGAETDTLCRLVSISAARPDINKRQLVCMKKDAIDQGYHFFCSE